MSLSETVNRSLRQLGFEIFRADPETLGYGRTGNATLRNRVIGTLARAGYGVRRTYGTSVPPHLVEIAERVRPYTMTSPQSVIGLCEAVEYIARTGVPGALVECGVWRGGSVMAIALTLRHCGACDRELYLFDTFAGMTRPDERDLPLGDIPSPLSWWEASKRDDGHNEWAYAPIEEVRANVLSTGYPPELMRFVKGPVEQTLPDHAPNSIALLRLDTDWHASTSHELEHLFPRLSSRGVLILDDYGSWAGLVRLSTSMSPSVTWPSFAWTTSAGSQCDRRITLVRLVRARSSAAVRREPLGVPDRTSGLTLRQRRSIAVLSFETAGLG